MFYACFLGCIPNQYPGKNPAVDIRAKINKERAEFSLSFFHSKRDCLLRVIPFLLPGTYLELPLQAYCVTAANCGHTRFYLHLGVAGRLREVGLPRLI